MYSQEIVQLRLGTESYSVSYSFDIYLVDFRMSGARSDLSFSSRRS